MKTDRFLLGILIGIGVLAVAALGVFLVRQSLQAYGPEDTPAGVVNNYILATSRGDYERAYAYLANPGNQGLPTLAAFQASFLNLRPGFTDTSVLVGETTTLGDQASVSLTIIEGGGSGPFGSPYRRQDVATLVRQGGAWKISQMPYPFWSYALSQPTVPMKEIPPPAIPAPPALTATPAP